MNQSKIYILIFLAIIHESPGEIIQLNDENFSEEITKLDVALVVFFAPWCGQCEKLIKILPEIDTKMQTLTKNVTIVTVNCEKEGKTTCDRYHIGGFPILKSFLNGNVYGKFEDIREVDNIVEFMRVEASPVAEELNDFLNVETILRRENRVGVIGKLYRGSKLEAIFFELAEKLRRRIIFLYRYTEDNLEWIKVYRRPLFWNKFEDPFVEYNGDKEPSLIEKFIMKNFHGLVGFRTSSTRNEFNFPLVTVYLDIDYERNAKLTNYWRNRMLKVAAEYKDKFTFAMSSKEEFYDELKDMGLQTTSSDKPIVAVVLETNEKFILSENFSVETLRFFLRRIVEKSLNPYLKSQKPPDRNYSYVVGAVGSTFYDIVIKNSNDTMVKIFANWCGHCKKLRPTYKKLAKLMANEKITFVEIDGTENDLPVAYTPTGYPTIYWSTRDYRMTPILYQGDRTLEDFIKFIAKHASAELRNYDRDGNLKSVKTEL